MLFSHSYSNPNFYKILHLFSYKDCPPCDLDKFLEDVQNGLHPITAYHLLYPTHSSLSVNHKPPSAERSLTASLSNVSIAASTLLNTDSELTNSVQSITDSLASYPVNPNEPNTAPLCNGLKSRTSTATFERASSATNDAEYTTTDSISTLVSNNSSMPSLSNGDEKENRRIIEVQCKVKTKETRSSSVKEFL